jgi:hypothetical protein
VLYLDGEAEVQVDKTNPSYIVGDFINWWNQQCSKRGVPAPRDPACYRVVRSLLKKYGLDSTKRMAVYFFENHAGRLREGEPRHFILFSSMRQSIESDMKGLGLL